jgi:hypothetical protein
VAAELATPAALSPVPRPGLASLSFDTLTALDADRAYKLGVSLHDAPLTRFRAQTAGLPLTTKIERLVVQRTGQDIFRAALMDYWGARCPITGITDPALLRASQIVPWAECGDAQRLDVHNGLLLSALWDAAFPYQCVYCPVCSGGSFWRSSPTPTRRAGWLSLVPTHAAVR